MKRSVFITFFVFLLISMQAQTYTTAGKDFWVAFASNGAPPYQDTVIGLHVSIIISSDRAVSGNIINPNTNWSVDFSLDANQTTQIEIPKEQAYNYFSETVTNRGLHITSSDTIWLYASNYHKHTFDVANIAPIEMLSTRYMIQTYPYPSSTESYGGYFLIVATENNTTVHITPTAATHGGHYANIMFTITLQQGQSYLVVSEYSLSGSIVEALNNKKIAVYNGVPSAHIPLAEGACDHLFEQAYPPYFWGQQFAVVGALGRHEDRIAVTAMYNNTNIKKNGVSLTTIQAGATYEIINNNNAAPSCFIETSKPANVYQYLTNGSLNNEQGDPSSVWLCPTDYYVKNAIHRIIPTGTIDSHFANIITSTDNLSLMRLNNQNIASSFQPLNGNPDFSYAQIPLIDTLNFFENDSGFVAYFYGTGNWESYFYSAGFQASFSAANMLVNDILMPAENQIFCVSDTVHFACAVDYLYNDIIWNFGDGSAANGCAASHLYTAGGAYPVSMIVARTYPNINNVMYDTITAVIYLDDTRLSIFNDTICYGESYIQHGFNIIQPNVGTMSDTIVISIPNMACDSLIILNLNVISNTFTGEIIGETLLCTDHVYTYSLTNFEDYESIVWSVSEGCTIQSGQNTASVAVSISENAVSGTISVVVSNRCSQNQNISQSFEIFNPNDYVVSGGGAICSNDNSAIQLNQSHIGVSYQIYRNGVETETWMGDGLSHNFGPVSESGIYTIKAILEGCFEDFIGDPIVIKVIPNPPAREIHRE
ncbi:MAG: PKD domain-containing protein [Bacteroidales bacterium]|nr:PKD domain-containing protein [Bacteroidales bacterium]